MNPIQSLLNRWQYLMSWQNIYSWLQRKETHTTYFWQVQTVGCCKTLLLAACLANQRLWFLPGAISVHLQKRMDGGSGLCSGSAHCPHYYCEKCEVYLLVGYKCYGFACFLSTWNHDSSLLHLVELWCEGDLPPLGDPCARPGDAAAPEKYKYQTIYHLPSIPQKQCFPRKQSFQELYDVAKQRLLCVRGRSKGEGNLHQA